jgi:integrase
MRWAWREENVELENLPRNINDHELRFTTHVDDVTGRRKQTRSEQLFTKQELRTMLKVLPERFGLYILLCLNCGFTQGDLATLRKVELRLKEGRIVRQRAKTRRHPNPPLVNYKLWPKTLRLLKSHISEHPELVFLTKRGTRLIVSMMVKRSDGDHHVRYDTVCRTYGKLRKKHSELPNKSLKFLRKTGSTKLRGETKYMLLDQLYLGHSHKTIADRHYNAFDGEPHPPLDEAITWLGKEFGLLR